MSKHQAPQVQRDLACDTRDGKVGEVMADPEQDGITNYWVRPVGGGYEYEVPREYVEIIEQACNAREREVA